MEVKNKTKDTSDNEYDYIRYQFDEIKGMDDIYIVINEILKNKIKINKIIVKEDFDRDMGGGFYQKYTAENIEQLQKDLPYIRTLNLENFSLFLNNEMTDFTCNISPSSNTITIVVSKDCTSDLEFFDIFMEEIDKKIR